MTTATRADAVQIDVSDEELEAAADEMALSYTYQTSAYNTCCN